MIYKWYIKRVSDEIENVISEVNFKSVDRG